MFEALIDGAAFWIGFATGVVGMLVLGVIVYVLADRIMDNEQI